MNWRKGKSRLIILFLGINILLGWANYKKVSGAYLLKDSQIYDIRQVMEKSNIFVDTEIPKAYRPLQKLTVFPYKIDSNAREILVKQLLQTLEGVKISVVPPTVPDEKPKRIYTKGEEVVIFEGEKIIYHHKGIGQQDIPEDFPENLEPEESPETVTPPGLGVDKKDAKKSLDVNTAKRTSEKWLKQMGYSPRDMHTQVVVQEQNVHIIYYDKYEGTPVFDSYVKMTITPLGMSDMEIHKVELGDMTGEKQKIYSADQVFFYLIPEIKTGEPVHIKDIMIGYALENPKGTHLMAEKAIPFYQVTLEDGTIHYIDAYNNEIVE